ncbi:CatA-like O-acetyltransferase [Paludicola sp. MB14-C6]|uniref:CatA-like O-acetyltransferase n=1 Tax=Paludihabitans sp. MB14-C6 TaxID=3070656 RepID=UPI0027DB2E87|nr:CatA-like O-acetyltransferase [Paludicola sp. MB14-C6]WMJ22975.1 CatA-like O-acetyltransferase [Paludicola sp. MB14-C6]
MNELKFEMIDMETWNRAPTYHYFTEEVTPTSFTVNIDFDITVLKSALKAKNLKLFPTYLYIISNAIKKQNEFRLSLKDNKLGYWNFLSPQYPIFHEDSKTITFLWTEYDDNFYVFYNRYLEDVKNYNKDDKVICPKGNSPENTYIISCIPWFTFNGLAMNMQNIENYFFPMIVSGGLKEEQGRMKMPLSITINHAAADGYHIHIFQQHLQHLMNHPQEWMK